MVFTTVATFEEARSLARGLVTEGLAACANVLPGVTSIYRWKGALHEDPEILVLLKTPRDRLRLLAERLGAAHPYEVPEMLALEVAQGSPGYLAWLKEATRSPLEEQ